MLLNLDSQRKVWLDQSAHFEEFYVWPRDLYFQQNPDLFADLIAEAKELERLEKVWKKRRKS